MSGALRVDASATAKRFVAEEDGEVMADPRLPKTAAGTLQARLVRLLLGHAT